MAGNGNRLARVNSELQRVISHVINFELKNTKVTGLVSVTRVRITPQLVFEYDDSELHGEKIDMILKKIKEDDMKIKGDSNDND